MTVRLREIPARLRHAVARARSEDRGVSPVVGMILVLAISIVGIAAILYWGLPAIDEMKANVEYRSVTSQFTELDSTIKELVAGTTEKTAKRWQPALNRGTVTVRNNTEGWLMSTELYNASANFDFVWLDVADGDNTFRIVQQSKDNAGSANLNVQSYKVEGYIITGTTTQTTLNVTGGAAAAPAQMTNNATAWSHGAAQTFSVWVKDAGVATPQKLTGGTFKFRVYSGASLVAEAWFVNTGRVEYSLPTSVTEKTLVENNGALIAGMGTGKGIINTPPLPPPVESGGTWRFFARLISVGGNASFGGESRFDLLISLYTTATLASYDCALETKADCVETAKVFIYGEHRDTWYSYLTSSNHGYRFGNEAKAYGTTTYLEQRETAMAYTLLGSTVLMVG